MSAGSAAASLVEFKAALCRSILSSSKDVEESFGAFELPASDVMKNRRLVFRMEAEFLILRWTGSLAERVGGEPEGRAKPPPLAVHICRGCRGCHLLKIQLEVSNKSFREYEVLHTRRQ